MSKLNIKKNDTVIMTAGVNAGKTGKVLQVLPARERVLVEGLNLVKKTLRRTQDTPQGGIVEKERAVALSNVMLYCPECKRGRRVRRGSESGRSVRKCAKCGHSFDG